jgi:CDP-diglyceride synthetase
LFSEATAVLGVFYIKATLTFIFQADHGAFAFGKLIGKNVLSNFFSGKTKEGILGAIIMK